MGAPTFVTVLETEEIEAITELRAKLYRSYTVIRGLVVERPVLEENTVGIGIAALVNIITDLWLNVRVDDVLEARCIRIVRS